jgi:hypothetical protein
VDNGSHCAEVHQEIIDRDVSYVSQVEWSQCRLLGSRGQSKEDHLPCGANLIKITLRDFILMQVMGFLGCVAIKV